MFIQSRGEEEKTTREPSLSALTDVCVNAISEFEIWVNGEHLPLIDFPHNPLFNCLAAWAASLGDYPAFKWSQMLQPLSIFPAQVSLSKTLKHSTCTNCSV